MTKHNDRVALVHLSDLHLGGDFLDTGRVSKATVKSVWRKGRLEMQAHDGFVFASLRTELTLAARAIGAHNERFDFHVVTGDISTTATTKGRFAFAREYLTGDGSVASDPKFGLRIAPETLFCVPGNHDKMNEVTPERYLSSFADLPSPPPFFQRVECRGREFHFFGLDSNLYGEGNIGVGEITPMTLAWLRERLAQEPINGAVRLLLLHHHPVDLNRFRRRSLWEAMKDRFTVLEEGERLLGVCRGEIDVILHGHEHFPIAFPDERSGCIVVSAGTTLEWQRNKDHSNSFHALVFEGELLKVTQFNWNGSLFERKQDMAFDLPLSAKRAAAARS